ncbi:unnamed protein product [Victoria cruziana]
MAASQDPARADRKGILIETSLSPIESAAGAVDHLCRPVPFYCSFPSPQKTPVRERRLPHPAPLPPKGFRCFQVIPSAIYGS